MKWEHTGKTTAEDRIAVASAALGYYLGHQDAESLDAFMGAVEKLASGEEPDDAAAEGLAVALDFFNQAGILELDDAAPDDVNTYRELIETLKATSIGVHLATVRVLDVDVQ